MSASRLHWQRKTVERLAATEAAAEAAAAAQAAAAQAEAVLRKYSTSAGVVAGALPVPPGPSPEKRA